MIRWTPEVMEDIRAAVVDGFYKLSRGGLEVGGVLFGWRGRDTVEIRASRPVPCQHAYGPSFKLSEVDLAGLAKLLESVRADPALAGMVPVGWYHSRTRSGPELSETGLEIHNRYFPEPWHVALILRPERYGPTKAVFYARDKEGVLREEPAFILKPAPTSAQKPPRAVTPRTPPEPENLGELPPAVSQSGRLPWALFALAWLVAVASTAIAARSYWWPKPPPPLELTLQDINGQLAIQWQRSAPEFRDAEGGILEIEDGDQKRSLQFNAKELQEGSVLYGRQTGSVTVRLHADLPRGRSAEGTARFAGEPVQREPVPGPDSLASSAEIERLTGEIEALKTSLAKQNQRNRDLEAAITALRKRLAAPK